MTKRRRRTPAAHAKAPTLRAPRLDATNLAGLTSLMNHQNLRPSVNLEAAEEAVMRKAGAAAPSKKEIDPVWLYTKELNELAEELGIDFLGGDLDGPGGADSSDDAAAASSPALSVRGGALPAESRPRNPLGSVAMDRLVGEIDLGSDSDDAGGDESEARSDGGGSDDGSAGAEGSDYGGESGESDDESRAPGSSGSAASDFEKPLGIDFGEARRQGQRRQRVHSCGPLPACGRPRLSALTEEQERRQHINSVMEDMRQETRTSFGVEHERVQDVKASKLEQIGQLRMTLEEEGVDCSGVGAPMMASPVEEIDSVLAILKLKNDRNRYSSLAEEVILGVSEGIETVFDGTREVPVVGWKPDYTGYHNTVNVKLHRMRFETSQVVGNIIEKYNIGPTTRIIMELLPSFFLYPRQQHKQRGAPGLHADFSGGYQVSRVGDASGAYSAIRRADDPSALDSVADI